MYDSFLRVMKSYLLAWWSLFIFAIISNTYGQLQREMSLCDMQMVQSRLQFSDFYKGRQQSFNMPGMNMVSGKMTTVQNMVKYSTSIDSSFGQASHYTIVIVIDAATGKQVSQETHGQTPQVQDELLALLEKLIRNCNNIPEKNRNEKEHAMILALLEKVKVAYETTGNIRIFERALFKFSLFSNYSGIMRQLLQVMRLQYSSENQVFYVSNIEFILQIQRIVETFKQMNNVPKHAEIERIINRIMESYYSNKSIQKFVVDLREFRKIYRLRVIIIPLIRLVYQPPPLLGEQETLPIQIDAFQSALQRLIHDLQGVHGQIQLGGMDLQMLLLAHLQNIKKVYLTNLYQLPRFEELPQFNYNIINNVKIVGFIQRYLIILMQQYNKQHDPQQTQTFNQLIQILGMLIKCHDRLPAATTTKLIKIVFSMTLNVKVRPDPTRCVAMVRILEVLYQLTHVTILKPEVITGKDKLIALIIEILHKLKQRNPHDIQISVPEVGGFEEIVKMIRLIFPGVKPEEPEDDFIIQIKLIIERIEIIRRQQNNTSDYETVLKIVKMITGNYKREKTLRLYLVDELKFHKIGVAYGDIFIRLLEIMKLKYIEQGQHEEFSKLIQVIEILKINFQQMSDTSGNLLKIKEVLLKLIKGIWMNNQLDENYIVLILGLKERGEARIPGALVIKLISIINQLPRVVRPIVEEDWFVKKIKLYIVLLEEMHNEGNSHEGYCHTMFILQTILEIYLKENRLPDLSFSELKVYLMYEEYHSVINKLMLLLQKKFIDQKDTIQVTKWTYMMKIREFIFRLKIDGNAKGEIFGFIRIEVIMRQILEDLYIRGKLTKDYITIFNKIAKRDFKTYEIIILNIFGWLETCPGMKQGDNEPKGPADIIIVIIQLIQERSPEDSRNSETVIIMLKKIIQIIKSNGNHLPKFSALNIQFDLILRSGFSNQIIIQFLRDLLSFYSKEHQVREVDIIVKINYLMEYIAHLRNIQIRVNEEAGFRTIFESLIKLINDMSKNGRFTQNYVVLWQTYLVQYVEYKTVILLVIEYLNDNPCQECTQKTSGEVDNVSSDESGIVIKQSTFEGQIKEVRIELNRLYHDTHEENGFREIEKRIEIILRTYQMNSLVLPKLKELNIQFYLPPKNYGVINTLLIQKLIAEYESQGDTSQARILKIMVDVLSFMQKISKIRYHNVGNKIKNVLEQILIAVWENRKIERDLLDQVASYQVNQQFTVTIVKITEYLKTLPGELWSLPVVQDDFQAQLETIIIQLRCDYRTNGAPELVYEGLRTFIQHLIQIYVDNGRQLPLNMRLTLLKMYGVMMHFPGIWRMCIEKIIAQYHIQNNIEEIRRFQFMVQMHTFLRQMMQVRHMLEWKIFNSLINSMDNIFSDCGNGLMRQNYIEIFLPYCRYQTLMTVVPQMVYYLTNWSERFVWIHRTEAQISSMLRVRKWLIHGRMSENIVTEVVTIWNGNEACDCIE